MYELVLLYSIFIRNFIVVYFILSSTKLSRYVWYGCYKTSVALYGCSFVIYFASWMVHFLSPWCCNYANILWCFFLLRVLWEWKHLWIIYISFWFVKKNKTLKLQINYHLLSSIHFTLLNTKRHNKNSLWTLIILNASSI
jgi:hypothetical protein